ncbi:MAG: hypothetical protein CMC96_06720 [Flavobacteriales bacterium]|nr:hypothetical protein [Flavobacteriales bacterium]|tara:strand:+ start:31534 stop:31854 length:321 start_codon:yes stop_codon:yes gene_type:complete
MEKEGVLFLIASLCVLISYYMRLYDYKKVNYLDNNLISIVSNLLALTSVMLYLEAVRELIENETITNSYFLIPVIRHVAVPAILAFLILICLNHLAFISANAKTQK